MDALITLLEDHGVQWSVTSVPGRGYTAWLVVPQHDGVWSADGPSPAQALQNALYPLFRHVRQTGYAFEGAAAVRALWQALGALSPRESRPCAIEVRPCSR